MAEYIEREAAIDTVGKWLFSVFGMKETDRAATVFQKLRSIPAADVRPVVLCRDCMMRQYCKVAQYLGADGFCSNGEKREES